VHLAANKTIPPRKNPRFPAAQEQTCLSSV
jgi:hypothetical protein